MISSILAPDSRFSKTVDTGIRVSLNTHAPLRLPGTLSTAGHCDQSRAAMFLPLFIVACYAGFYYGFDGAPDGHCGGDEESKCPALSQETRQERGILGGIEIRERCPAPVAGSATVR